MKKIKILNRGFNSTHYGYLKAGGVYEVAASFAGFCVEKMKAAEYVATPKRVAKKQKLED